MDQWIICKGSTIFHNQLMVGQTSLWVTTCPYLVGGAPLVDLLDFLGATTSHGLLSISLSLSDWVL